MNSEQFYGLGAVSTPPTLFTLYLLILFFGLFPYDAGQVPAATSNVPVES
jgi:hypothetical protein